MSHLVWRSLKPLKFFYQILELLFAPKLACICRWFNSDSQYHCIKDGLFHVLLWGWCFQSVKKHLNAFLCKDYRKFRVATAKRSRRIKELQHKVLPSGPLQCHCLVTMINKWHLLLILFCRGIMSDLEQFPSKDLPLTLTY